MYSASVAFSRQEDKNEEIKSCRKFNVYRTRCICCNIMNASGGCETAVTSRIRIGWIKFRECGELLRGRKFFLRMKGMVYRSCIRVAVLYGSETWCLRENEMTILRRTERAMVRSMCKIKLVDSRNMEELMRCRVWRKRWIKWQRRME